LVEILTSVSFGPKGANYGPKMGYMGHTYASWAFYLFFIFYFFHALHHHINN